MTSVTLTCDGGHSAQPKIRTMSSEKGKGMTWLELPKRVHYALKSLYCLASAQRPVCAREVARRTGIPPAEAAKILYLLTWGRFVSSRRGSNGGFWLRKHPGQIRIGDVVKFLHPGDPISKCSDPVLQIWQKTETQSQAAFNRFTLEDVMKQRSAVRHSAAGQPFRTTSVSLSEETPAIDSRSERRGN